MGYQNGDAKRDARVRDGYARITNTSNNTNNNTNTNTNANTNTNTILSDKNYSKSLLHALCRRSTKCMK